MKMAKMRRITLAVRVVQSDVGFHLDETLASLLEA